MIAYENFTNLNDIPKEFLVSHVENIRNLENNSSKFNIMEENYNKNFEQAQTGNLGLEDMLLAAIFASVFIDA